MKPSSSGGLAEINSSNHPKLTKLSSLAHKKIDETLPNLHNKAPKPSEIRYKTFTSLAPAA